MVAPVIGLAAKEAIKQAGKFVAKRDPVVLGAAALSPVLASIANEGGKKASDRIKKERDEEKKLQEQYEEQDKQEGRGMKKGGKVKSKVSSASKRADGCAQRGKTRGRMV